MAALKNISQNKKTSIWSFRVVLKRIFQILFILAVVVSFCVAIVAAVHKQKQIVCSAVQVKVSHEPFMQLLDEREVEGEIIRLSGRELVEKQLSRIDFRTLEHSLEKNPYVKNAELYYDQQHSVRVDITQRQPLMRVINNDGVSYYLSEERVKMPLHHTFTTNVPLAVGFVQTYNDAANDSIVEQQLFELAQYITKDSLLKSLVDHIFVNEDRGYELIPKVHHHTIYFGKWDETTDMKFNNLKAFYRDVLMKQGWDKYSRINISIPNQVSAVKRFDNAVMGK